MIRLIACDLDETLLTDDKHISEANRKAIKKAKAEYDVLFVPASGRGYTGISSTLKELEVFNAPNEYTISNNGGITIENKGFQHITFHSFDFNLANELFEFGIHQDLCVEVFTAEDVYAFQLNAYEREWLFMFKHDAVLCEENSIAFLKDEPIVKILFEDEDMERLQRIAQQLKPLLIDKASFSFSSGRYLELNPIGIHKGMGLKELADYLGIPMEQTMAIGDNYNDIEMLQMAGIGIAVANAANEIKEVADYVTVSDYTQSAVAEAIERFIICKDSK